jgi:hypothetical protein
MEEKKEIDFPKVLLYTLEFIVMIIVISYFYFSRNGTESTGVYSENAQKETIKTLMYSLNLQNVHEIPYVGLTPKIQIYLEEDSLFIDAYYVEIIKGDAVINNGESKEKDITIKTTSEEISKMATDSNYAKESINSGKTVVKKISNDFILYSKGFPDLNWTITG